ncbi:hypothetical protein BU26DRAFT_459274 [Trematosphaeria pertusa]|uniref:Opioid growth factor receptor (OGFr) conserved domain-containing protein n=1 Tax=Trematosphaeria pertusa TaxID=390896 RepID=A0A6A6I9S8_9PLEO|nr:uncharacterized protein BU26DRAFT_459274 [Trematosphaeria pertusa]KAF2247136.1 hypothetical protein BU26DRAFT_459274 [Trematosphaeria pertusa]
MAPNNPFNLGGGNKSPLILRFYDPDIKARDAHGRTLDEILDWRDAQLERSHDYIQILFPLPEGSPFNYAAPIVDREVMEAFHSRTELKNRLGESFERMIEFYGFAVSAQGEDAEEGGKLKEEEEEKDKREATTGAEEARENGASDSSALQSTEGQSDPTAASETTTHVDVASNGPTAAPSNETTAGAKSDSKPANKPLVGFYVVRGPHWQQAFRNWAIRFDHNHLRITRILRCLRVLGLQTECEAFYTALKAVFNDPNIYINERSMIFWRRAVRQPLYIAPDGERIAWLKKWEQAQEMAEEEREAKKAKTEDDVPAAEQARAD